MPPGVGGDQVLHRGEPVRVDDHDRVDVETIQHLAPQPNQPRHQRDLFALVELETGRLVEHDGWSVTNQPSADYLTHASSWRSLGT